MKFFQISIVLFVILIVGTCCSTLTYIEYDKTTDFSKYKTFNVWKTGVDKMKINNKDKESVVRHIDAGMLDLGFNKSKDPDLLINLIATGENKYYIEDHYPFYWYNWGPSPFYIVEYTEGSLYVELIDKEEKKLIWRGKGVSNFGKHTKDKDRKIEKVVNAILSKYPKK